MTQGAAAGQVIGWRVDVIPAPPRLTLPRVDGTASKQHPSPAPERIGLSVAPKAPRQIHVTLTDVSVNEDNLGSIDALIDALFAGPPHRFVPGRDELAKRLIDEGREEDAAELMKLSKPPVSVWLVNQWARRQPVLLDRLLTAFDNLLQGEQGADRERFLQASNSERAIVEAFEALGADILFEAGVLTSSATVDRAMKTLRAATAHPVTRAALTAGRLTEELGEANLSGALPRPPSTDLGATSVPSDGRAPPRAPPPNLGPSSGPESDKTLTIDTVDTPRFANGRPAGGGPALETRVRERATPARDASRRHPPPVPVDDGASAVHALRRDEVAALAVQLANIEAEASVRAESLAEAERQLESIRVRLDEAREVVFRRRRRR